MSINKCEQHVSSNLICSMHPYYNGNYSRISLNMLHKYLTNSNGTGDGEIQNTRNTDYEKEHLRTKNYELK